MSDHDATERTEDATPQRREKARKEGQVANSTELGIASTMLVLVACLAWIFSWRGPALVAYFQETLSSRLLEPFSREVATSAMHSLGVIVATTVGPVAAAALVMGVAVNVAQVGINFNWDLVNAKWDRLDPSKFFERLTSSDLPMALLKAFFKGLGILSIALYSLRAEPEELWTLAFTPIAAWTEHLRAMAFSLTVRVLAALAVLALVDVLWTRHRHEKRMRMTKQEIKEEMKETDGDPHLKATLRRRARELATSRLEDKVKQATVIATNPTHYSVALRYLRDKDPSPRVLAKGKDFKALKIREFAKKHGIPIIEDKMLTRTLFSLVKEGDVVPAKLYRAVARLLAIVYRRRGANHEVGR